MIFLALFPGERGSGGRCIKGLLNHNVPSFGMKIKRRNTYPSSPVEALILFNEEQGLLKLQVPLV